MSTPQPNVTPPVVPIKAPEVVRAVMADEQDDRPGAVVLADPTQVRRPLRATVRTVFQALVSLAALAPLLAAGIEEATGYDLEGVPYVVTVLAIAAAVTRVMAIPQVETFLQRFLPFLSAAPKETQA